MPAEKKMQFQLQYCHLFRSWKTVSVAKENVFHPKSTLTSFFLAFHVKCNFKKHIFQFGCLENAYVYTTKILGYEAFKNSEKDFFFVCLDDELINEKKTAIALQKQFSHVLKSKFTWKKK